MKKVIAIILTLTLVLPGATALAAKEKVGISMPTKDLQRWNQDGNNLQNQLATAGYDTQLSFASNDVPTQLAQIENMIDDGCKVIIIAAIEGSSLGTVLNKAAEKGVKIIAYDRLLMDNANVDYYVSFDNYEVGVIQANYIKNKLSLDSATGPFRMEFTAGDPGDNNAGFFFNGAMDVLKPYIDAGKVIVKSGQNEFASVATPGWKSETAQKRAEDILLAYYADGTTLDAWLCSNDSTAYGVTNALEANYVSKWPIITGQDCDKVNVRNMIAGKQAMSVFKDTRRLVTRAVTMVGQILKGSEVEINDTTTYNNNIKMVPAYLCSPSYVDASNYSSLLIDSGYYTADDLGVDPEADRYTVDRIRSFVARCYRLILGREPETEGLTYWTEQLLSGYITAAEIINGFVKSDEFRNKNLSYEEQVEILYKVMLNRESDAAGKAYWVSMLSAGNSLAVVINGFCGSDEFAGICAEYGITPGSVDDGSGNAAPAPAPAADLTKIRAFVTRNYRVILGREPDADGLNYWAQRLASGEATAAEIINGFVNSDEFKSKNLSYGDQVEVLYQVMLDRGSDAAGKSYWVSMLNGGNPLAAIINGFCNSVEFKGICAEYGITPGSVDAGEAKPPREEAQAVDLDKIRAYVSRCYRIILGREPDQEGLNYWTGKMASGELQAAAIIDEFVNSAEFMDMQLSDREAVEVLYQAMLGRGSDAAGMAYWLEKLDAGEPFAVIINGFCNSVEFRGICAEYGITPGSVAVASVRTHAVPEEQEIPEAEATEPEEAAKAAPADERTEQARAFVTHCYQSALLRDPGAEEVDYYANQILSGQMTAKDVARAFAFSQEFQSKWTDSTAFVRVLYRLCLDREADADGLVYWTDKLANGETAAAVFNALTENKEFVQVCATYGVPAGVDANAIRAQEEAAAAAEANEAPAAPASEFTNEEKIRAFVSRFYRDAMGREADEKGLNYYTGRILSGEATPKDVARDIILSEEFHGRMPGNEDLVRILYRVYLGREADEEGLANWAGQLDSGVTLETILNGFAGSEEFATVVNGLR